MIPSFITFLLRAETALVWACAASRILHHRACYLFSKLRQQQPLKTLFYSGKPNRAFARTLVLFQMSTLNFLEASWSLAKDYHFRFFVSIITLAFWKMMHILMVIFINTLNKHHDSNPNFSSASFVKNNRFLMKVEKTKTSFGGFVFFPLKKWLFSIKK